MKRGQITLFIILFFIGLILAFFVFSLRNASIQQSLDGGEITSSSGAEQERFNVFLDNCVEKEMIGTLNDLFANGGFLFEDEYGSYNFMDVRQEDFFEGPISYSIAANVDEIYELPLNFKPNSVFGGMNTTNDLGFPTGVFNQDLKVPYFGTVLLPKLCMRDGPNSPTINSGGFSCPTDLYSVGDTGDEETVQGMLSKIFTNDFMTCVESKFARDQFDTAVTSFEDLDVVLGKTDIILESDSKIFFLVDGDRRQIPIKLKYDIDLKNYYSFIFDVLDMETKDVSFNIGKDYVKSVYYEPYYEVKIEKDIGGTNSDLFIVKNNKVNQEFGTPLEFQGLIENRRPFLEVIDDLSVEGDDYSNFDLTEAERTKEFTIQAYDPDGDDLSFFLDEVGMSKRVLDTNRSADLNENGFFKDAFVGKCSEQCNSGDGGVETTDFEVQVSVEDVSGEFDYQNFNVTVLS